MRASIVAWSRGASGEDTRTSYDTVAESYADKVRNLLDETPEERAVLALFAVLVRAAVGGPVADVGCGPGRITAYLTQLGVDASGSTCLRRG